MAAWYYTTAGNQPQGPVEEAALDQLIADNTVTPQTLVWKEGMAEWVSLATARGLPGGAEIAAATCTVCGQRVGADNLIDLLGHRVCAACKPQLVQSLREGASPVLTGAIPAWRDGKRVVTSDQATLPPRCVKCNCPAEGTPIKRKLYWHPPGYYLLIFIGVLVYVLVAIFVRKWAVVHVHMCPAHRKRRTLFIAGAWTGVVLSIFMFFGGVTSNTGWLTGLSPLVFLASLIAGIAGGRLIQPTRIKDKTVWLAGAGREFIASLPELPRT